uniref:Uncharacterized protein IVSP4-2 n=1 Tax=Hyposoter didymator TaxID=260305 RepID=D7P5Q0_HYPDD|nr:unknown [Hyposoter didymator]
MATTAIMKTNTCLAYDTVTLPCATIKSPKMIKFSGNTTFDISFIHPGQKVQSVDEALRFIRTIVSWTTSSVDKIREILRALGTWKFPTPRRSSNIFEITYRFALQHFYRYCCISDGSKLIYDETYFDDLNDYMGENGYVNGQIMWLPPALICETLLFIKEYDENIDYQPEDDQENENYSMSDNLDGNSVNISKLPSVPQSRQDSKAIKTFAGHVVTTNYTEAKNIILSFIKEVLTVESQVNTSALQFFSKQWLSNVYKGCYQFASREAFCMFFNNICIFEFSQHVMFRVPDIRGAFTRRLIIPEVNMKNIQKPTNSKVRDSSSRRVKEGSNEEIGDVLGQICGFKLVDDAPGSEMDLKAINKLNRIPSMIVRMCPNDDDSSVGGGSQLRTATEILGGIAKGTSGRSKNSAIANHAVLPAGRRSAKTSRLRK